MRTHTSACLLFLLLSSLQTFGQCEKRIGKNGIKVYACENAQSDFKSAKAEFTIRTNLSNFVRFMWDVQRYDQWQYKTIDPRLLHTVNSSQIYYYVRINSPVFVQDRDLVIDMKVSQDTAHENCDHHHDEYPSVYQKI